MEVVIIGNQLVIPIFSSEVKKTGLRRINTNLSQGEDALLGPDAASLDHDKVLLDQAVMGESAHGVDGLVSQVIVGSSVVLHQLKVMVQLITPQLGGRKRHSARRSGSGPLKKIIEKKEPRSENLSTPHIAHRVCNV